MPSTRSASKGDSANTTPSSSPQTKGGQAGTKRKADDTPTKDKSNGSDKKQKTIEDTIGNNAPAKSSDVEMKTDGDVQDSKDQTQTHGEEEVLPDKEKSEKSEQEGPDESKKDDADDDKERQTAQSDTKQEEKETNVSKGSNEDTNKGSAIETDEERKKAEPSNILEKGIIYFFFRGRVNVEDPKSVGDIQRSYFLLRPLPSGASLGDGTVPSGGKARIVALPKKVLPKSARNRFLCFVEAANSSFDDIKKQHLSRDEYKTKTSGDREVPAAQPAAEGIYAITATGRESHLAYILTVPETLGEVQKELGLSSKGAFVTSVRNPDTDAPTGTVPDQKASYSKEIMDDFRGLRWGRLEPRHLDYQDTHFLLIGEHEDDKLEKSVKADEGDGTKDDKNGPKEEMELLSKEDEGRIRNLAGDDSDAIFKELGLSKEEFSKVKTSW